MRRTYCTLNDCEMQHNAEVGLFTKPSFICKKQMVWVADFCNPRGGTIEGRQRRKIEIQGRHSDLRLLTSGIKIDLVHGSQKKKVII